MSALGANSQFPHVSGEGAKFINKLVRWAREGAILNTRICCFSKSKGCVR